MDVKIHGCESNHPKISRCLYQLGIVEQEKSDVDVAVTSIINR